MRACACVCVSMTCPFNRRGSRELAVGEPGVPGEQGLGKSRSHFHQTTWRLHGSWQQPVHTLPVSWFICKETATKKEKNKNKSINTLISDIIHKSHNGKKSCICSEAFMLLDDCCFSKIDISEVIVCISRGNAITLY